MTVAALNIGLLVFREGLECVLVLAAITANMLGNRRGYRRPVFAGAAVASLATLVTWGIAVAVVGDLSGRITALELQAVTGLLAVIVLLLVMNWFFHRVYWTGWISLHSRKKEALIKGDVQRRGVARRSAQRGPGLARRSAQRVGARVWWGLAALGFTSLYREGFEVVLFLQSYRLRLGDGPVAWGVVAGVAGTAVVGVLTLIAHRRLPYRRMLVFTGVLLGVVLLVMVGEQAQEMQQAAWLSRTEIAWLAPHTPEWLGTWLSVFPTVETLAAQALAAALVLGSYSVARPRAKRGARLPDPVREPAS